jgi:hypothetical protein
MEQNVGPKLVYDASNLAKMFACGTLPNFMMSWNTLFSKEYLHVGHFRIL